MKSATSRRLLKGEMIHPQYACLIDKLGWLATISRPDIALAYSLLAKFAAAGGERHCKCAIGVVEYLAKPSSKALIYRRDLTGELDDHIVEHTELTKVDVNRFTPKIFPDASHGGEKPQAGYMIFHGEDLISFHSGRLRTTPLSSTQGEYDIATKAVQTGLALSNTITFALEDLPDFLAKQCTRKHERMSWVSPCRSTATTSRPASYPRVEYLFQEDAARRNQDCLPPGAN